MLLALESNNGFPFITTDSLQLTFVYRRKWLRLPWQWTGAISRPVIIIRMLIHLIVDTESETISIKLLSRRCWFQGRRRRGNFARFSSRVLKASSQCTMRCINITKENNFFLCKVYRIKLNEWDVDQWERNSINAKRLNYKTCLWVNIITSAEKERPRLRISNPHSLAYFKYFTLWCHRRRRLIATLIVSRSLSRRRILDDWLIIRWELIMRESIWRGSLWWPFVVCLRILKKLMMWTFLRNNFGFSDRPMFVDLFRRKKNLLWKNENEMSVSIDISPGGTLWNGVSSSVEHNVEHTKCEVSGYRERSINVNLIWCNCGCYLDVSFIHGNH